MYVLFDIGGTKMRISSSRDLPVPQSIASRQAGGEPFGEVVKEETPAGDFEAGMEQFKRMAEEAAGGEKIEGIAGGVAGPLDREKTGLVGSPHIGGWAGKPLKERLSKMFDAPVFLENDSALVGLGEATAGAGQSARILAYITVSTGVGGARIVDGKIDASAFGFEPGHQVIDIDNTQLRCKLCGMSGDLESLISGSAMKARYNKEPYNITDAKIWDEYARLLAVGLNNVTVMWSPDAIVLGGSMIVGDPGISVDTVRAYFKDTVKIFPELPEIRKAALADQGGLHGALALLRESVTT